MLVRVALLSPNHKMVKEILDVLSGYPSIYKVRGLYYGFKVNEYTLHLSHSNDCPFFRKKVDYTHFSIIIEDKNGNSIFKIEKTAKEWDTCTFASASNEKSQAMGLFDLMDLAESVWKLIRQ